MAYLAPTYHGPIVAASLLIAVFASYVALELTHRVRRPGRGAALGWVAGGALAMGTGVWCTHFVGMLAFSLPIPLGYRTSWTAASWAAAVTASALGLAIVAQNRPRRPLAACAVAIGGGIGLMHYMGMAALDIAPPIDWNLRGVAVSVLVGVAASGAALAILPRPHAGRVRHRRRRQAAAAALLGGAVWGLHFAGMGAAQFPLAAVCRSAAELSDKWLGALVSAASLGLLAMTLLTARLDARLQNRDARLAASMRLANSRLQAFNAERRDRERTDALTGLPNRAAFERRLGRDLSRSAPGGRHRLALLLIGLDGFRKVNDSLGHATGDDVLREVAQRLLGALRPGDALARIGSDEFGVLRRHAAGVDEGVALAARLLRRVAVPYRRAGRSIHLSASVGIVVHPDAVPGPCLVARADAAMAAAKRSGGGSHAVFEPHMDTHALDALGLENDLRHAIGRGELTLHYQPKVDARRGTLSGVEALLRWTHPVRGPVDPVVFIAVAERSRLIGELGDWVVAESCRQLGAWSRQGLRIGIAINLSAHQLRDRELAARIGAALARHRVDPARLLCEITESVAMEDIAGSQRTFGELSRIGVFLAIDDFGTGYSSLSYLRQLPARQLKIDQSFVRDIVASTDARAIVAAVVQLAHALGLRVVGEGVETEAQREVLVALGCDELQGYLFARPMPVEQLLAWRSRAPGAGGPDNCPRRVADALR